MIGLEEKKRKFRNNGSLQLGTLLHEKANVSIIFITFEKGHELTDSLILKFFWVDEETAG
jgi:hypothetical protein